LAEECSKVSLSFYWYLLEVIVHSFKALDSPQASGDGPFRIC
jgi:hypothetical protein